MFYDNFVNDVVALGFIFVFSFLFSVSLSSILSLHVRKVKGFIEFFFFFCHFVYLYCSFRAMGGLYKSRPKKEKKKMKPKQ